jgi:hypothetical protein
MGVWPATFRRRQPIEIARPPGKTAGPVAPRLARLSYGTFAHLAGDGETAALATACRRDSDGSDMPFVVAFAFLILVFVSGFIVVRFPCERRTEQKPATAATTRRCH